jgi:hypothetical protein
VFEVYRDMGAYRSHLETAHFKATNEKMVKSSCPLDAYWLRLHNRSFLFATERRLAITWLFRNGRRIYSELVLTVLISPMKVRP